MSNQVSSLKMEKKFKKTPVGEIPVDWEVTTLGECASINATSLTEQTPPESRFRYIDISSVEDTGRITEIREVIFKNAPSRARRVVKFGDILVSTVRPYLKAFAKVTLQGSDLIASTGFAVITPKPDTDGDYLYQFTLSDPFVRFLAERMAGSNYPAVSAGDVAASLIPLPPIHEQKKIAKILSAVDDAIEKTTAVIEKSKELKKGLMQQLLTRGIGHEIFKETEVGRIPQEWVVVNLADKCHFLDSQRVPVKEQDRARRKGPYPYYGAQGIIDWIDDYIFDGEYILLAEDGENLRSKKLPLAYKVSGKFWVNNHAHVLKVKNHDIADDYLVYLLNFIDIRGYIVGSAQPKLTLFRIEKIEIPLPPSHEQKKIAQILSAVDDQIAQDEIFRQGLQGTKTALMQTLLTGRVRVKSGT